MTGARFRELRDTLGLSRARLAPEIGVHWNTINKWERGEQPIPLMASKLFLSLYKGLRKRQKKDALGA